VAPANGPTKALIFVWSGRGHRRVSPSFTRQAWPLDKVAGPLVSRVRIFLIAAKAKSIAEAGKSKFGISSPRRRRSSHMTLLPFPRTLARQLPVFNILEVSVLRPTYGVAAALLPSRSSSWPDFQPLLSTGSVPDFAGQYIPRIVRSERNHTNPRHVEDRGPAAMPAPPDRVARRCRAFVPDNEDSRNPRSPFNGLDGRRRVRDRFEPARILRARNSAASPIGVDGARKSCGDVGGGFRIT